MQGCSNHLRQMTPDEEALLMGAIRMHQVDGPESLRYEDAPKPISKDNQVLVQVDATAITPTEFDRYPTFHIGQAPSVCAVTRRRIVFCADESVRQREVNLLEGIRTETIQFQ
jgi:hypothetical protein